MLLQLSKSIETRRIDKDMIKTLRFYLYLLEESSINVDKKSKNPSKKVISKRESAKKELKKLKSLINDANDNVFSETFLFKKEDWLIDRISEFNKAIREEDMKKEFIKDALHDIEFNKKFSENSFQFRGFKYVKLFKKDDMKKIASVFNDLYQTFFSRKVPNDKNQMVRRQYIESILIDNDNLLVCPSCLGPMSIDMIQLDHYYPKSILPVLSLHPSNLVPICQMCNTSASTTGKGDTIPLDFSKDENKFLSLRHVYFPYEHSAHKKFVGRVNSEEIRNKTMRPFSIISCEEEKGRLENFSDLYHIEEKWSAKIPSIHMNIFIKAKAFFQGYSIQENEQKKNELEKQKTTLDESVVKSYLIKTYILNHDDYVLKLPDVMISSSYVLWLINSEYSLEAFVEELKSAIKEEPILKMPYFYKADIYM